MSWLSDLLKSGAGGLIPGPWGIGLGVLGGILGTKERAKATSAAEARQLAYAESLGAPYQKYAPGIMDLLWSTARSPESDPWYRSQMLSAEGDVNRQWQGAGRDMIAQLALSGGGRPGESSAANDLLLSLAAQRGRALTSARVGQLGQMRQDRSQALSALASMISGGPQALLGAYGGAAERAGQREEQYGEGLGDLWNLIAMQRYHPELPPSDTAVGKGKPRKRQLAISLSPLTSMSGSWNPWGAVATGR